MSISFVTIDAFAPEADPWVPVGPVAAVRQEQEDFFLTLRDAPLTIRISALSPSCLRVRFDPRPEAKVTAGISPAVVERSLGPVSMRVMESSPHRLGVDAGEMRFAVDLRDYALHVYRNEQLICADHPGRGLVYRPGQHGIANIKTRPENALYCGFGEKAGDRLIKNGSGMTDFSFDNFIYAHAPVPEGGEGGPLNPAEPLYASIPLLIEIKTVRRPGPTKALPTAMASSSTTSRSRSSTSATSRPPMARIATASARCSASSTAPFVAGGVCSGVYLPLLSARMMSSASITSVSSSGGPDRPTTRMLRTEMPRAQEARGTKALQLLHNSVSGTGVLARAGYVRRVSVLTDAAERRCPVF